MIEDVHFLRPFWLLALLPWAIILFFMFKHKLQQGNWVNVCDEELLPYILQQKPVKQSRVGFWAGSFASLLTLFALAGPTYERLPTPVFRNDSGLVILLDLSRSMEASDVKPSRLVRARYKIADILQQRKDGQTALIVYAGDAFTVTPLTEDSATIKNQLDVLSPDIMPVAGSNTRLAIEKAVELLKNSGLQQGSILLVTDGVDLSSSLEIVKNLEGYQLSVFAIGTEQGAPIKLATGGFLKDRAGNIVVPKLDLQALQTLANAGNGVLQTMTANDSDVKAVIKSVDNFVQNSEDNSKDNLFLDQWDDKGAWLLLLVLPLVALNFRRGVLSVAFLLFLPMSEKAYAFEWQDLWKTQDQQAQEAFNKGQYDKAAELFEDPAWKAAAQYKSDIQALENMKKPKTATGFYNQGNVLAKSRKYQEAIDSYNKALELEPNHEDAKYNKELIEKELEKQQQDNQQQQNQDQQQNNKEDNKEGEENKEQQGSEDKQQDSKEGDSKDSQEQQANENSSEQENSKQQEQSEQQKQQSEQEKQPKDLENEKQQAQAEEDKKSDEKTEEQKQAKAVDREEQENEQATEQWLNRIQDDPAALLRRKFKHQYGLRKRRADEDSQQW